MKFLGLIFFFFSGIFNFAFGNTNINTMDNLSNEQIVGKFLERRTELSVFDIEDYFGTSTENLDASDLQEIFFASANGDGWPPIYK